MTDNTQHYRAAHTSQSDMLPARRTSLCSAENLALPAFALRAVPLPRAAAAPAVQQSIDISYTAGD